jgi:hypothetical protein
MGWQVSGWKKVHCEETTHLLLHFQAVASSLDDKSKGL